MSQPRGRIVALVIGCLLLLPALGLLAAGGALGVFAATQRDADGYFEVTLDPVTTPTVAVASRDLSFAADPGSPDWVVDWFDADVRLRVSGIDPDQATFVGIGRAADVDRYLAGSAHTRVVELTDGVRPVYEDRLGATDIAAPTTEDFWVADAVGVDTVQLDWEATAGRWSVVVMNADGSPGVAADVEVGLRADFIVPLTVGLLAFGFVLTAVAVVLVVVGASRQTAPDRVGGPRTGGPLTGSGGPLPPPTLDAQAPVPSPELQEVH